MVELRYTGTPGKYLLIIMGQMIANVTIDSETREAHVVMTAEARRTQEQALGMQRLGDHGDVS